MITAPILFPERIRDERFRTGTARAVDYAPNFSDLSGQVISGSKAESDLIEIIRLLKCGGIIPERFYRNGIGRDSDALLANHGIKHLHLESATSDILIYMVEYETSILLLEVNTHSHFASKPVGSILRSLHQSALYQADNEAVGGRAERIADRKAAVSGGLLPRRSVIDRKAEK